MIYLVPNYGSNENNMLTLCFSVSISEWIASALREFATYPNIVRRTPLNMSPLVAHTTPTTRILLIKATSSGCYVFNKPRRDSD